MRPAPRGVPARGGCRRNGLGAGPGDHRGKLPGAGKG
jgi:hypothetical protein